MNKKSTLGEVANNYLTHTKRNKGITLIALVVTIIVLLILAGISIMMLTGQNGILNRASEAKENTGRAEAEELVKLSVTDAITQGLGSLTDKNLKTALDNNIGAGKYEISGDEENGWRVGVDEKEYKISSTGNVKEKSETALPSEKDVTLPYWPTDDFEQVEDTDLSTGLVIKDSIGNEYVWVEVPKTIYKDSRYNTNGIPESANEWEKIRDCLKKYTADYSSSHTKDTDTDGTYSEEYQNMLKSVYTNGGFWLGRYEAGIEGETTRTGHTELKTTDKAVVKPNKMPWIYVTKNEANELAKRMNYNGVKSSLIYGVQWDLVLKYIETKKEKTDSNIKTELNSKSTTIGNYFDSEFIINRGKFTNDGAHWYEYNSEENPKLVEENKKLKQSSYSNGILLTTGATEHTNLQNIYDIAGNVWEWTLEFSEPLHPSVYHGGCYQNEGSAFPANSRSICITAIEYSYAIGFRIGLWK